MYQISQEEVDRLKDFVAPLKTAEHFMRLRLETAEAERFREDAVKLERLIQKIIKRRKQRDHAPELLEALRELLRVQPGQPLNRVFAESKVLFDAISTAHEAIAKAEGR